MTQTQVTPDSKSLSFGGQLVLWSLRTWTIAAKRKLCVHQALDPIYQRSNCQVAVAYLDESMSLLALAAFRPMQFHCHCSQQLSDDELCVLQCLRALQRGDESDALRHIQQAVSGRLALTFCRVAGLYVEALRVSGHSLAGVSYLTEVK